MCGCKWSVNSRVSVADASDNPGKQHEDQAIAGITESSIASLVPCLKGFFFLAGQPYPKTLADLFEHAALITKTDIKVMHGWMQEKNIELADVERYLSLLSRLMELMQTYPVEQ
jgi:hypothetical protein